MTCPVPALSEMIEVIALQLSIERGHKTPIDIDRADATKKAALWNSWRANLDLPIWH